MSNKNPIRPRKIADRVKLEFLFPNIKDSGSYIIKKLPFYENIRITEKKSARYQSYSPIGRSSNLYAYLGAESRKLELSFNLTLDHIVSELTPRDSEAIFDIAKKASKSPLGASQTGALLELGYLFDVGLLDAGINATTKDSSRYAAEFFGFDLNEISESERLTYLAISCLKYWINLIRSSTTNNSQNPVYGPPIIRLSGGFLHQNIPCICKGYNLKADDSAGYHLATMTPRVLSISMELEEVRAGDFGKYDRANSIKRDNLAGWEAVLDSGGFDPEYYVEYNDQEVNFVDTSVPNNKYLQWIDNLFN